MDGEGFSGDGDGGYVPMGPYTAAAVSCIMRACQLPPEVFDHFIYGATAEEYGHIVRELGASDFMPLFLCGVAVMVKPL
jgi:hypothetical protein